MSQKARDFFQRFAKLNMLNFIIICIVIVWSIAVLKGIFQKNEPTEYANQIASQLKDIMVMVLGYFLKEKISQTKE